MAWKEGPTAWRTTPRPTGWKALRAPCLERDGHQCTWIDDGVRCAEPGTDADHVGDPDDHSLENLRTLCDYHHKKRTALQARAARGEMPSRKRPAEQHPGLINSSSGNGTAASAKRNSAPPGTRDDVPPF